MEQAARCLPARSRACWPSPPSAASPGGRSVPRPSYKHAKAYNVAQQQRAREAGFKKVRSTLGHSHRRAADQAGHRQRLSTRGPDVQRAALQQTAQLRVDLASLRAKAAAPAGKSLGAALPAGGAATGQRVRGCCSGTKHGHPDEVKPIARVAPQQPLEPACGESSMRRRPERCPSLISLSSASLKAM